MPLDTFDFIPAPATHTLPYWQNQQTLLSEQLELAEIRLSKEDSKSPDKPHLKQQVDLLRLLLANTRTRLSEYKLTEEERAAIFEAGNGR